MAINTPLQNLTRFDKLVNPDGTPTDLFMRILQNSNLSSDATAVEVAVLTPLVTHLDAFAINTTAPITGGPVTLGGASSITLDHANSGVTPGTKGGATKSAVVTVDDEGHVTDLTDIDIAFTVEVEDEGASLGIFSELNFAGAGVTATNAGGGVALVTIPGGGGGGGGPQQETVGIDFLSGGTSFGAGYCGSRLFCAPRATTITGVGGGVATANGTSLITPVVYGVTTGRVAATRLGLGPQVTGIAAGCPILPLTTPVTVVKGDFFWVGWLILTTNVQMMNLLWANNTGYFAQATSPPPDPSSASLGTLAFASFFPEYSS